MSTAAISTPPIMTKEFAVVSPPRPDSASRSVSYSEGDNRRIPAPNLSERAYSFVPENALSMGYGRMPRPAPASRVASIGSQKGGLCFFCTNLFWLASCLGGLTNGMMHGHVAAVIQDNVFRRDMPMSSSTLSLMVSMMQVGALVGSVALGSHVSDRHGRRIGMAVSMLLFVLGCGLAGSCRSPAALFAGRSEHRSR
eukprot:g28315.t1